MNNEKFYEKLKEVPELNPDLFEKIESSVKRRKSVWKHYSAFAASAVIALGVLFYSITDNFTSEISTVMVSKEIDEELQIIDDYLDGSDTDEEYDDYIYTFIFN